MSLETLFHPRAVAVIGASTNPDKIGGVALRALKECGFSGAIYPINPIAREILGLRVWPAITALPEAPDVAIVAVPASQVEAAFEECIAKGVGAVVVFSSGFAEGGEDGLRAQQRLSQRARESGVTLLGPNCLGVMNVSRRWVGTFSPAPLAGLPAAGNVAIVSQSGAFGAYAFSLARKAGIGLSQWVTTGNQANVSVADVIEWLAGDDETRVIVAYIEGTTDGQHLRQALLKARGAGKPVIVTKVGRTAAGAAAAMSHTASLSGDDAIYQALIEETGAVRAFSIEEMFRLAQAFAVLPMPQGDRLGVFTVSGGVGTMMADTASDEGLQLPPLPHEIADALRQRVAFCSTTNPVDITGQFMADYEGILNGTLLSAARSGAYDALVLFLAAGGLSPIFGPKVLETFRRLRATAPALPLVFTGLMAPEQTRDMQALGVLVYEEPTHAIATIARMHRWRAASMPAPCVPRTPQEVPAGWVRGTYNEAEGLSFLERARISPAPYRIVHNADQAVAVWRDFGQRPVVLKIVSRDILHKSDVGGVCVGPRSEAEVREAYTAIEAAVSEHAPQARREGMLVARKLAPRLELILGARHDDAFGTLVVLGRGGVAVELEARTLLSFAPCRHDRVREQLGRLGVLKLLAGFRGQPAMNPGPLIDLVVRFSELAARLGSALKSMEVNPLMVTDDGVYAADAVVEIR